MKAQLLVLLCLVVSLNSQVLGIDLGTEFLKAAIISPGKSFVIVENTRSERKTPNAVPYALLRLASSRTEGSSRIKLSARRSGTPSSPTLISTYSSPS